MKLYHTLQACVLLSACGPQYDCPEITEATPGLTICHPSDIDIDIGQIDSLVAVVDASVRRDYPGADLRDTLHKHPVTVYMVDDTIVIDGVEYAGVNYTDIDIIVIAQTHECFWLGALAHELLHSIGWHHLGDKGHPLPLFGLTEEHIDATQQQEAGTWEQCR